MDYLKRSPSLLEVTTYFAQMGLDTRQSDAFYFYYTWRQWKLQNQKPVKNWKVLAFNWVKSFAKAKPILKRSIRCH